MSVINPLTGRSIKIDGPTYKELLKLGYYLSSGSLVKKQPAKTSILPDELMMNILKFLPLYHILQFRCIQKKYSKMVYCIPDFTYWAEKKYLSTQKVYPTHWIYFTHTKNIHLFSIYLSNLNINWKLFNPKDEYSKIQFEVATILISVNYDMSPKKKLLQEITDKLLIEKTNHGLEWWMTKCNLTYSNFTISDYIDRNFHLNENKVEVTQEEKRLYLRLEQENISIADLKLLCKLKNIRVPNITSSNKKSIIEKVKPMLL